MNTKICLGIATNRLIRPKTVSSILNLAAHSKYELYPLVSERGYNTSENRNYIVAKAVNSGCSHLFFIDDDIVFEPDTLDRLMAHDKDIVGALYLTKYEIQEPVIEYLDDRSSEYFRQSGFDIFKCGALGTGCLLIKTEVFKKVPQIWFTYEWNDNGSVKMSHDWLFCHKVREYNFDVWCDPTIPVGHIGQKIY